MSDNRPTVPTFQPIDEEILNKISGGDLCSAAEIDSLLAGLKDNYDTLVDFTSYVIERVITSSTN